MTLQQLYYACNKVVNNRYILVDNWQLMLVLILHEVNDVVLMYKYVNYSTKFINTWVQQMQLFCYGTRLHKQCY